MADSLVLRFLRSTVRDCHCKYRQSRGSDAGTAKLSPSMYIQNMGKMCAAPAYWLLVVGAKAAEIDFATAMDNHCRNRSARCKADCGQKRMSRGIDFATRLGPTISQCFHPFTTRDGYCAQ